MVKIQINVTLPNIYPSSTIEQKCNIENWFRSTSFELPFIPAIGMEIDLDDFFTEKELAPTNVILGYLPIKELVIKRDRIVLYVRA